MAEFREGQTAKNAKGERIIFSGGQWKRLATPPGAPPTLNRALTPQEQKELNIQNQGAQAGLEAQQLLREVGGPLKRLKGGPFRGAFLDAAIAQPGGGFLDKLGAATIGGPASLFGYLTDQDVEDYQAINRAASLQTRQSVTGEKGTQTEGDAARALISTATPYSANPEELVNSASAKAARQISRAAFYTQWANKYGLNGVNEGGQDVESAFQASLAKPGAKKSGVTIRRVK